MPPSSSSSSSSSIKQNRYIISIFWFVAYVTFVLILTTYIYTATHIREEDIVRYNPTIQPSTPEHLNTYGFSIFNSLFSKDEIENLKQNCVEKNYESLKSHILNHPKLQDMIQQITTSPDYVFQDYIWIIEKSSVHTCHRDNNGDFFNQGQQHPSYTMIIYLEDMGDKCLTVIPRSQENINSYFTNFNNALQNIQCKKGDIILFNANLIHAGTITEKENNIRIQLKITHKDDIPYIDYYQNYNKVLDKENPYPNYIRKIQQNISCVVPGLANLTQKENIRTARGSQNGVNIGFPQKMFSYMFYGNQDYYDLPNAF